MKKLLLAGAVGSMVLMGCKKDGGEEGGTTDGGTTTVVETTVAEDKENLHAAMDEIVNCLSQMKNGAMMNSMVAFTGLSEGEALKEDFIEGILYKIEDAVDTINVPGEDKFYFTYYTGTWSYQIADSSWTRSSTPTDKIVVEMPSDDAQTSNNVVCTLQDYSDKKYTFDLEDVYLPKSLSFTIVKDGAKIGGIELNDLALEQSDDIVIPTAVDGEVYLSPFTFTMEGERTTTTEFNASVGIDDGTGCAYDMSAKLKLKHDDYENIADEDVTSIEGSIGHNSLKVNYFVDYAKIAILDAESTDGVTEAQVNENIDLDVLINDAKIGNLVIKEGTGEEEVEVHIEYKDGSMENTDVYYIPFVEDVEALFEDLTGPWTEDEAI